MTTLDDHFATFQAAFKAGDRDTMMATLQRVPDADMDAFLAQLEAAGMGPGKDDELEPGQIDRSLRAAGVPQREATSLSILIAGTFADFVRDRMTRRQIDADSILRRIDEGEAGDVVLPEEDEAQVRAWIAAVLDGDDDPEVGLPDGAEQILAAALDSSPRTIAALRERG